MIRCAHIFKELAEIMPQLRERYKDKDLFYIGLRLDDKQVPKVEVFLEEIEAVLFQIIDTNGRTDLPSDKIHKIWQEKDYRGKALKSVFICDVSSQTVYDSRQYQQSNQKYKLSKDKDPRIQQFTRLAEKDRDAALELTIAQIQKMQDNYTNGTEPDDSGNDNSWGEMPWDFAE